MARNASRGSKFRRRIIFLRGGPELICVATGYGEKWWHDGRKSGSHLLADDDENDTYFIERALKEAQVANPLRRVRDGEEAIAYLKGEGGYGDREKFPLPHLMLLDLKMPRKNGFEVLEWVRGQPGLKRLPVIILTSSKEDSDINHAYDLGANTYLVKPSKPEGLRTWRRRSSSTG